MFPRVFLCLALCVGVWGGPSDSLQAQTPLPLPVPPPRPSAPLLPPPPLQPLVQPLAHRDVAEIQRLTPRVEIWRPTGLRPQVPTRNREVMSHVFVTGLEPVTVRLQFDPRVAGERVTVIGARGISLNPPEQVLIVSSRGECTVSVQLTDGAPRGHLLVYCKMLRTVVPLTRAPLATVQTEEARTGGRP